MPNRAIPLAVLAVLAAASLAACSSRASSSASAPASSAPAAQAAAGSSIPAYTVAPAKACAELDAWQKKHGDSAAPSQEVFDDLIDTPQPLSVDFTTWDFAVETNLPDAEADLLKVWTDCAKAEAAAMGG